MKKIFLSLLLIIMAVSGVNIGMASAKTAVKKPVAKVKAVKVKSVKAKTTMPWSASGLKLVNNMASFDYNNSIRNAYVKKVEAYAKRNHIKLITAQVVNGMRE